MDEKAFEDVATLFLLDIFPLDCLLHVACVHVLVSDGSESRSKSGGSNEESSERNAKEARGTRMEVVWEMAGVAVRDTAPFTTIRPVNNRRAKQRQKNGICWATAR